jgi:hypothetical protein
MADDIVCDYVEADEIGDDEAFALMVEAFEAGMIAPADRAPVLRLFTGTTDLVFVLAEGGEGDAMTRRIAGGSTIRLSSEVQQRLARHFAHWLAAN